MARDLKPCTKARQAADVLRTPSPRTILVHAMKLSSLDKTSKWAKRHFTSGVENMSPEILKWGMWAA